MPHPFLWLFTHMDTGHALPDRGHDLVADRSDMRAQLLRRDALVALRTEEHDLVPRGDVVVPAIDDDLVHRHGAGDAVAFAGDEHVGLRREPPPVPVGVPDRYGRYVRWSFERVPPSVRDALAGVEALHHRYRRTPPERRPQTERRSDPASRVEAIDRGAGSNDIEMGLGEPDRRRAVRGVQRSSVEARGSERVAGLQECPQLVACAFLVLLRCGEVGPQPLELEP